MMGLLKKRDASGRHKKAETEVAAAIEGTAAMATDTASVVQEPDLFSTTESAGMKVVAVPTDAVLDIVFVHGLTGHREETWTHKNGLFWPALLAKDINTARIMTFGYDAGVVKLKGMVGDNNIRNHGKNLATDVSDQRRDCRNRPIIFIAHSLGGLVCEQALLYCREKGKLLEKVFRATRGIIFMGTPHAGADLAALAHSLAKYLNIVRRTNVALLDSLRRDSDELTAVQQRFQTLLLKPEVNIEIYCFFEEQAVTAVGTIVPENSAVLNQYDNQSIAANHMDMTKFSGVSDGGYQKVLNRAKDMIEAIDPSDIFLEDPTKHPDYKRRYKCHRFFRTSEYERHKERNPNPVEGTCQWFLQHQNYTSWRDSLNSTILWVSADPGCGKSVLSRLLADKELQANKSRTTCYFFFKDDNEEQKTATNALCALLHQIFNQNPVLLGHAIVIVDSNGEENVKKSIDLLWKILITVAEDPRAGEIVCILDALDECKQSELNPLLQKLCPFYDKQSQLFSKIALKFIMTGRPLQYIEDEFNDLSQKIPGIRLAGEEDTDQIRHEIDLVIDYEINKIQQKWSIDQNTVHILQEEFSKVEHRTYLWLMLIFDLIRQDLQSITKKGRERLFRAIPKSVDDAYTTILNKSKDKGLARKLLQIVCAATRPLSVKEIITALWIEEDHETYEDLEIPSEDYSKSYIRNLCGLFVSVNGGRVFLLHQTAKEFLLSHEGYNRSALSSASNGEWKNSISMQDSSLVLASSCMWFLRLKELNDSFLTPDGIEQLIFRYEFFDYSAGNWVFHFQNDVVTDSHPLIKVGFELCNVEAGQYIGWRLWQTVPNSSFNGCSSLHWASSFGLEKVVRLLLATPGIDVNAADNGGGRTPLWQAAYERHEAVVRLLLAAPGIDVNAADSVDGRAPLWKAAYDGQDGVVRLLLAAPDIDVNAADNYGRTPLWQAAYEGHEAVVHLLLTTPNIDVNAADSDDGQAPLWQAASEAHEMVVRLLLATPGIDVNAADNNSRTPLWQAASEGHDLIVRLLLAAYSINVNAADKYGRTPLWQAASKGQDLIVSMLLAAPAIDLIVRLLLAAPGIDVNAAESNDSRMLLWQAAYEWHDLVVRQLLSPPGIDANATDNDGRTPLWQAAYEGHETVVRLLLATPGIDINDADSDDGQAPLWKAVYEHHEVVVRLLLAALGIDVNATDNNSRTPLWQAASEEHDLIVRVLLAASSINVNAADKYGRTPLWQAAYEGHETVVRLLLATPGIDVNAADSDDGQAPLWKAAYKHHEVVVRLLLAVPGIDVNTADNNSRTPLWQAASKGHGLIVRLLLAASGINVNAADNYGRTPLWQAAYEGHERVVRLLLTTPNIDVNAADSRGRTPLSLAREQGSESEVVIKLLENRSTSSS